MIVIITNHSTEIVAVSQSDLNNSFSVRLQLTGKGSKTFVYFNSKVTKACHKKPKWQKFYKRLSKPNYITIIREGGGSGCILAQNTL